MREIATILKEVFGDSSESDTENESNPNNEDPFPDTYRRALTWDPVTDINGLWICRDFLSPEQQSFLLLAIQNEGWFTEASHNQAMRFGDLPAWAFELSNSIHEAMHFREHVPDFSECSTSGDNGDACIIFPPNFAWREPLFNQLIANVYQPGEGINAHVDLMRFDDGIAIISLESSCIMHFTKVKDQSEEEEELKGSKKHPVYLNPGSLVLMWGEARYHWTHEINRKPGFQVVDGKEIEQRRRISITLRKLLCQFE